MPHFHAGQTSVPLLGWSDACSLLHREGLQASRQLWSLLGRASDSGGLFSSTLTLAYTLPNTP